MSGKIHRFKKEKDFVTLDNHALRNDRLSWKGKGLHCYLMQLPDDWQINIADLQNRSSDGRDSTSSGLRELISAGYVVRERVVDDKTKQFIGYDYQVYERPEYAIAVNGKPVNGSAVNGKPVTTKYEDKEILRIGRIKEVAPVSENSTGFATLYTPDQIENLEITVVEGETFTLEEKTDLEKDFRAAGREAAETEKTPASQDAGQLEANNPVPPTFLPSKSTRRMKQSGPDLNDLLSPDTEVHTFFQSIAADWQEWKAYKIREKKGWYKTTQTEAVAIRQLRGKCSGDPAKAAAAIYHSIGNDYTGIWPDKTAEPSPGPCERYSLQDYPRANTPEEMRNEMSRFYHAHQDDAEGGLGYLESAQKYAGTKYAPERIREIVTAFCSNRLKNNRGGESFQQQHAALCLWLQEERKRDTQQRNAGPQYANNPADRIGRAVRIKE